MTDPIEQAPDLRVGEKHWLDVHDLAFGGEGVARHNDFVIFVPFVLPGEKVEAEITEVRKNFARGRLLRVLEASPERVAPPCRYFGECGGCQYQHIDYGVQLRLKHKQIRDLFQRVGGFSAVTIDPVVPCPQSYGYRNRLMIRSQWNKPKQKLNIGFLAADSRLVVDVEECKIAEPALNEQIQRVRAHPPPRGGLKVVLRLSPEGWEVPKDSFFQNNFLLLPELVKAVRSRVSESGVRHLIDVYCGVGFFALETADLLERFIGVESDKLAVHAARQNQLSRGIRNGDFIIGRAEEELPTLARHFAASSTTVLLDPPRTGCPPASLQQLREAGLKQVIYVSCHPATLARDLKILCQGGRYDLLRVTPLDMFPQTQHVECVADLRVQ
ncbi:MAG: class I SAM-dependent RNA methyltransferase [Verrucomicrobiales bacterium]|nr:class I SAM-dependent RNA methyltransferase [Verrucomicrobiales bacterium]